jgi:putative transposase
MSDHFSDVDVIPFIVMPNHVHAIITIHEHSRLGVVSTPPDGEATPGGRETLPLPDLGQIIGYYKYQTTKQVNALLGIPGTRIWQRNYYERIIRDQGEFRRFSEYILSNPQRWRSDQIHPFTPPNQFNQESS